MTLWRRGGATALVAVLEISGRDVTLGEDDEPAESGGTMTNLEDILTRVLQELGPDASDDELKAKVLEIVEALPEDDKRGVLEQMVELASNSQLAHLRKVDEGDDGAVG